MLFALGITFSQNPCSVKEVKSYRFIDDSGFKDKVLESILFYRFDGQLDSIVLYDTLQNKVSEIQYKYDQIGRCTLSYTVKNGIRMDSVKAVSISGEIIPIRQVTFRNSGGASSDHVKIRYNACGDPVEVIRSDELNPRIRLSKYQYTYSYW